MLADEEVAVVEGGGSEGYDGLVGVLEIGGRGGRRVANFVVFWLWLGNCDFLERVVDFSGLAIDLLNYDCLRHCGGELEAWGGAN